MLARAQLAPFLARDSILVDVLGRSVLADLVLDIAALQPLDVFDVLDELKWIVLAVEMEHLVLDGELFLGDVRAGRVGICFAEGIAGGDQC